MSHLSLHYGYDVINRYTNIQAFGKLVVETNDFAGQRELIAEYLQNEVFKPLNDLVKNTTTERKKMMAEGQKLQMKLKESMDQLENVSFFNAGVHVYVTKCKSILFLYNNLSDPCVFICIH